MLKIVQNYTSKKFIKSGYSLIEIGIILIIIGVVASLLFRII